MKHRSADFTVDQNWAAYTAEEHDVWRRLYARQAKMLPGRVVPAFLDGLKHLGIMEGGIPDFEQLSDTLEKATGWRVVAVPGLVPDLVFFELLANRRFPSSCFIRKPSEMDYLLEPDVFHDVFGHVPLLMHPVFSDYLQAYGEGGLKAERLGVLHHLARLYWYTVEFGLIATAEGLRIYGAGIVSSKTESTFCLDDPSSNRIGFDLMRVMRTAYRIDDYQETYFVIESFKQLFALAEQEFTPLYKALARMSRLQPGDILLEDKFFTRGTGAYHAAKRAA